MANQEQSAESIFESALDLPSEKRTAFLDEACRTSPEVRKSVEQMLVDYVAMGNFLDETLVGVNPPSGVETGPRFGRYIIIEPLGAGGMGEVYRARDETLERVVALKTLAAGVIVSDDARRRFRKEALALAKLSNPHIAAVYDVGEQDGTDYIVMECVPGETLATRLKAGPLPLEEATLIVQQIAQALEEAHEQGVIHRDLKPANVMITPKGQVKVLDFGIAKLLSTIPSSATASLDSAVIIGTPLYMSPEQAQAHAVDARTDLWSLGVLYFEMLSGFTPFAGKSNIAVLHAIIEQPPTPLRKGGSEISLLAEEVIARCLQKDPAKRYQSAAEIVDDMSTLLTTSTSPVLEQVLHEKRRSRAILFSSAAALLAVILAGIWLFHRWSNRQWAQDEALSQIERLRTEAKPLAAYALLERARYYLPSDPKLKEMADQNTRTVSVTSSPAGATVDIQDYRTPDGPWRTLGTTPLNTVQLPRGYFRWKVSHPGFSDFIVGRPASKVMDFSLEAAASSPAGMVPVPADPGWSDDVAFVGWLGPYSLPAFFIDRYEVTNREYQRFVDSGGYTRQEYWKEKFVRDGREVPWSEAMRSFRDTTERSGPAGWTGGHYPEGQADYPVSGVSWYEAAAYAAYARKSLPLLAEWFEAAPPDFGEHIVPLSNFSRSGPSPIASHQGVGPYGTYDMAGNVREWVANSDDEGDRFLLGGSWRSPNYFYQEPETLSPFDRSNTNGFRCVVNRTPPTGGAVNPIKRLTRDFAHFRPVSDDVFRAYRTIYEPSNAPLNQIDEGVVQESADWREERVTFDTGYRGERIIAYLFLPKKVHPPYQTVLFFPSARICALNDSNRGASLGDLQFIDYVIQSGRAVMYPIYQDTYERRTHYAFPGGSQAIQLTTDRYMDVARSLDYLATRSDIDSTRLAYLGVSMGAAEGVIYSTLAQDRLRTAIFLDGGYFLEKPTPAADQADFAPHMKKPVLMVNGRYDYVFATEPSQNPMFEMLGTSAADKSHVLLESPHDVTEQRSQLVRTVLDWLDKYLGQISG